MYTYLERKFHENYNGDIDYLPKITISKKITKNMFFAIFFQNRIEKYQIQKIAFEMFY